MWWSMVWYGMGEEREPVIRRHPHVSVTAPPVLCHWSQDNICIGCRCPCPRINHTALSCVCQLLQLLRTGSAPPPLHPPQSKPLVCFHEHWKNFLWSTYIYMNETACFLRVIKFCPSFQKGDFGGQLKTPYRILHFETHFNHVWTCLKSFILVIYYFKFLDKTNKWCNFQMFQLFMSKMCQVDNWWTFPGCHGPNSTIYYDFLYKSYKKIVVLR